VATRGVFSFVQAFHEALTLLDLFGYSWFMLSEGWLWMQGMAVQILIFDTYQHSSSRILGASRSVGCSELDGEGAQDLLQVKGEKVIWDGGCACA
jgi:hypothetical protein